MVNLHLKPRNAHPATRKPQRATRNPMVVRKILTAKSEITPLTSSLLPNKLRCCSKLDGPFTSDPNRYLVRQSSSLTANHIAAFSAIHLIFRGVCFVWKPPFKTVALR
jgi:hypothetical protein